MATTFTIYHNPQCSKSRQTLALLETHNITPSIVEYLRTPPDAATIARILTLLDAAPRDIMRTKDEAYVEAKLDNPDLSNEALINAMISHPRIIERPIVVKYDADHAIAAAVGRPPENILNLVS